jgi:hypothetical protein
MEIIDAVFIRPSVSTLKIGVASACANGKTVPIPKYERASTLYLVPRIRRWRSVGALRWNSFELQEMRSRGVTERAASLLLVAKEGLRLENEEDYFRVSSS